jgi:arsenate reductase
MAGRPHAILFLCTGNSARSQMAEGFARRLTPPELRIYSAGTEPKSVHPRAVKVMAERDVDISNQRSKDVSAVPVEEIDLVVTLCGDAAERCPAFPAARGRLHWPIADPAQARGSDAEVMEVFRRVRDEIEKLVVALLGEWSDPEAADGG